MTSFTNAQNELGKLKQIKFFLVQYRETHIGPLEPEPITPGRDLPGPTKEDCPTLARLREMGVSFVNKEDLMQKSKG